MGGISSYTRIGTVKPTIGTLTSEEAAEYWSAEAVEERRLNAPESRE